VVRQFPAVNRPLQPVCSVCIANFNGEPFLSECLDSILAQEDSASCEIIVHDDASGDASLALLRDRYPQVEVLASNENVGFCVSNNRMVAHARGEYVLLLNNDAALFPDAVATLLAAARAQSAAGILTLPQYDWASGELVDRGCLLDPFHNPVPNRDPRVRDVAYGIGACLFLPRALWNELGGFPEWFESIAEDLYLCCLARLRGLPMQVTDGSGYRHRQGASFGGNRVVAGRLATTFRRRRLSERNKTATLVVCMPTAFAWLLLAVHAFLLACEGIALAVVRFDVRIWTDIYGPTLAYACKAPSALRTRRRDVQATRRVGLRDYLRAFTWMPQKLRMLRRHGVPSVR